MARVLITGGAGFIGSSLVRACLERGDDVHVIDNFSSGHKANLAGLAVTLFTGEITDPDLLTKAMQGCSLVFHEAAIPSVPRSVKDPMASNHVNVHGTLTVLECARKVGVRRVVYAASSSAYGETPTLPKVETMACAPLSPYAVAKLAAEHYMQAYTKCYGLETVSLRYFNVFGPHQDPASEYAAVVPKFITAALAGEPARIFGDGEQSRDFCFIENTVEANLLAGEAKDAPGKVFNVACGQRTTLLELVREIGDIVGNQIQPVHEAERAGDVRHSLADISAAKTVLGYTASVSLAQGLKKTVTWFQNKASS